MARFQIDVPQATLDVADDAIKRAKLAVARGLDYDAYSDPVLTLHRLGLPPRRTSQLTQPRRFYRRRARTP